MNAKKYAESTLDNLQSQINKNKYLLDQKNKVYTLAGAGCGVLGLLAIASTPLIAIPFIGLAGSFFVNKNYYQRCLGSVIKRLTGEKNHILKTAKEGINCNPEVNKKRKSLLDKIRGEYTKKDAEYKSSCSIMKVANMAAFVLTLAAVCFPGTVLTVAAIASIIGKYLADNNVACKKEEIEVLANRVNNLTNDYNLSVYAYNDRVNRQNRMAQTNAKATAKTAARTQARTTAPKATHYSKEDERAVDEYLRQMQKNTQPTKGVQKRKI